MFDQGDATNLLKELVSEQSFVDKWGLAATPPKRGGGPSKGGCVRMWVGRLGGVRVSSFLW